MPSAKTLAPAPTCSWGACTQKTRHATMLCYAHRQKALEEGRITAEEAAATAPRRAPVRDRASGTATEPVPGRPNPLVARALVSQASGSARVSLPSHPAPPPPPVAADLREPADGIPLRKVRPGMLIDGHDLVTSVETIGYGVRRIVTASGRTISDAEYRKVRAN